MSRRTARGRGTASRLRTSTHSGARSIRSDKSYADVKETYRRKERLDFFFFVKHLVKTEAETQAMQPQAKNCQGPYELEEAGRDPHLELSKEAGPY